MLRCLKISFLLVIGASLTACTWAEQLLNGNDTQMSQAASGVLNHVIPRLGAQNMDLIDSSRELGLLPLRRENQPYLDIRGAGDSGDTENQAERPPLASFASYLDQFSQNGLLYRGDVNVINWESVVGVRCGSYNSRFGFLSSPDAVRQALSRGFQVFALSNNHSRDCNSTPEGGVGGDGLSGEISTQMHMDLIAREKDILWNGVHGRSAQKLVSTREFDANGRRFVVAFSSFDLGRDECPGSNCYSDSDAIAAAMSLARADLKIVSIHAREWLSGLSPSENLSQLSKIEKTAQKMIEQGDADIVFGSGPHIAMPVRIIQQSDGGAGVAFFSLGNFIHPWLSAQQPNLIGRVLFDLDTLQPVQVQALMVATDGQSARIQNFEKQSPFVSGLPWMVDSDPSTGVKVGFVNVKGPRRAGD